MKRRLRTNRTVVHHAIFFLTIILLVMHCSQTAHKTPLKTGIAKHTLISELETHISEIMEKAMIPGLSVAVIRDGDILWAKGFGVKNAETKEPATEKTVYEACSLSKPVFAYAVLKLVERGELDLDTPLIQYVPESYIEEKFLQEKITDDRFRKITTRMVLSHTPGFPNWRRNNPLSIEFEPGGKFSYSGEGFQYLQSVVEHITGLSLNAFMTKEVFMPLGMSSSSYVWQDAYDTTFASPHGFMEEVAEKGKPEQARAAASLHTTAPDFARFVMAIMNHQGLTQNTVDSMLTPQSIVEPEVSDSVAWGLGIGLEKTPDGTAFWHWGDNFRFRCFVVAYPAQKIGVVYFTNSFYGLSIRENIVTLAIGGEHPAVHCRLTEEYGDADAPGMAFTRILVRQGMEAALAKYQALAQTMPASDIMSESAMNGLGYQLLRMERTSDAIAIFKLNLDAHPDSWNVYDSMAEAYMEDGQKELAIQYYKKSLELNPDNTNGMEMLKKLRAE
jgi:CubicO group peptidase (beta-lactamase class C family)